MADPIWARVRREAHALLEGAATRGRFMARVRLSQVRDPTSSANGGLTRPSPRVVLRGGSVLIGIRLAADGPRGRVVDGL